MLLFHKFAFPLSGPLNFTHLSVKPLIIVSVTSDLSTDQRVHRTCLVLAEQGFEVLLTGRQLPTSIAVADRPYRTNRFKLWFTTGPLFYAAFNIRLFFFLVFSKAEYLFANDLDALPANFLASRLKRIPLIYDSHEYYTGVPELENRPFVKTCWKWFERMIFPRLKTIITVNDSIASLYEKEYGKRPLVIRNVPLKGDFPPISNKTELRKKLQLPESDKLIILQGAGINIQRGAEEAVLAMQFLENTTLLIVGGGDVLPVLKGLVNEYRLENKIIFKPRLPYTELMQHTRAADLGLTLDKDTNINYRFSLPNKIFDYIHAGIPVLASRLPEVERIIAGYGVGDFIERHDPKHIAEKMESMLQNETALAGWRKNLEIASHELNWDEEKKKFPKIINEQY